MILRLLRVFSFLFGKIVPQTHNIVFKPTETLRDVLLYFFLYSCWRGVSVGLKTMLWVCGIFLPFFFSRNAYFFISRKYNAYSISLKKLSPVRHLLLRKGGTFHASNPTHAIALRGWNDPCPSTGSSTITTKFVLRRKRSTTIPREI